MNYINKKRATDTENSLIVEAFNSLKTRKHSNEDGPDSSKEGVTYLNMMAFIHVINNVFPRDIQ